MKSFYTSIVSVLLFIGTFAQTGIAVPEMTVCEAEFQNFISTYDIPGMTIAMAINGKLSYARAFGKADAGLSEDMQPYNMFRIASLSKPITSIGIMKMMEDGLLSLDDKVFGVGGLLENHWAFSNANITDNRVYDITVQMLLEHTGGWDSSINCNPNPTAPYPWFFSGCHPIDIPLRVTQEFGQTNPVKEEHLIQYILEKPLNYNPGTTYAYSNMGYLILSEIIEEISGMGYEAWVQQEILHPLGIYDMYIGENLLEDKREREGEYVGEGFNTLDLYGSGNLVPWAYGGASVNAMDGHGGWIATARDLVRLLVAVDGFATSPDILSSASIATMTTPSAANANYAKGWAVNQYNNWWHTGAISGTASVWVRASGIGGVNWAIILNKRITQGPSVAFWNALDNLGWNCLYNPAFTTIPAHDFFDAPTVNANGLEATNITDTTLNLSWTNGNGTDRIVVAKEIIGTGRAGEFDSYPLDGVDYTASDQFGSGDDLGDGSFVVYNGTGSSFSLENLSPGSDYTIRVYDYTKSANTGNNALYMLGNAQDLQTNTLGLDDFDLKNDISIYPTITSDVINVNLKNGLNQAEYIIYNMLGKILKKGIIYDAKTIDASKLHTGLYILQFNQDNRKVHFRFIRE